MIRYSKETLRDKRDISDVADKIKNYVMPRRDKSMSNE